jgi:hypothetical protein
LAQIANLSFDMRGLDPVHRCEFGIRMAFEAQHRDVQVLVLRQTAPPVLAGVVIGVAGALGLTRALSAVIAGMPYGVKPTDT